MSSLPSAQYRDDYTALKLPVGVTNEALTFMSDNYVPIYGNIGAISGRQTNATSYKKVDKTVGTV